MIRRRVANRIAKFTGPRDYHTTARGLSSSSTSLDDKETKSIEGSEEDEMEDLEESVCSSDLSLSSSCEVAKKKPWLETSREVYEEQLESLQEQLMTAMIDKQQLEGS